MITVTEIDQLQTYLEGVIYRANHHALEVNTVVAVLVGAVIWVKEGPIEIRTYNGRMANCIRFHTQGRSYVIGYSHEEGAIQVRANRQGGRVLQRFDNDSTAEDVLTFFSSLRDGQIETGG